MSRWSSRRPLLHLAIRSEGWRLYEGSHTLSAGSPAPAGDLDALISSLDALTVEPVGRGAGLIVVVSDRWVQTFDVTPPAGVRDMGELQQLATLRRSTLYGIGEGDHTIVAQWHAWQTFVAIALPRALLEALSALCGRHDWQLRSVHPQWVAALARPPLRKSRMWLAVADGPLLTVIHSRQGQPCWVRTQVCAIPAVAGDAQRLIDRSVLALPSLPPADQVDWIDVAGDDENERQGLGGGAGCYDFLATQAAWRRPSRTASAILVAVVGTTLATLTYGAAQLQASRQEQQALLISLAATAAAVPVRKTTAVAVVRPEQIGATRRLVARLDAPWLQWLRAFEVSAHPDTALMSLEIDAASQRVRGTALARSPQAMLGYIERLGEQAVLGTPQLSRHDTADKLPGQPLRFEFGNEPSGQADTVVHTSGSAR